MPSRILQPCIELSVQITRPFRPAKIQCLRKVPKPHPLYHTRSLSSSSRRLNTATEQSPPRWAHTPERMTAPVTLKKHDPNNRWTVNESQEKLDNFYNRLLGDDGAKYLTDEVKWLAVTHKSFDQGRRGYNDRLAFLGRRLFCLQASLHLLNRSDGTFVDPPDQYDREPFRHPGVDLLPRLTEESRHSLTHRARIAALAQDFGLLGVLRWKPRNAANLNTSGVDQALSQALYAIIGALAMQRGGEVAVRFVKDRMLNQMEIS